MPTNVIMPQLGESVVEGTLSRWLKKEGDPVTEFEPLMEVNTDKVDTEIPAPVSGVVLKLYVQEGTTVKAGTLVAVIGQPGEAVPGNGHEAQPAIAAPTAPVVPPRPGATSASSPPSSPNSQMNTKLICRWSQAPGRGGVSRRKTCSITSKR